MKKLFQCFIALLSLSLMSLSVAAKSVENYEFKAVKGIDPAEIHSMADPLKATNISIVNHSNFSVRGIVPGELEFRIDPGYTGTITHPTRTNPVYIELWDYNGVRFFPSGGQSGYVCRYAILKITHRQGRWFADADSSTC